MRRPLRHLSVALTGALVAALVSVAYVQHFRHRPTAIERTAATRARQARTVAKQAGLPPAVQDLLARAAGAIGERFTVTYRTGGETVATLTQVPPSKRVDESTGSGSAAVTRSLIVNPDGSFSCSRQAGHWVCQRAAGSTGGIGPFSPADIKATVEGLSSQRAEYRFDVAHRRIAGVDATCLASSPRHPGPNPQLGTLCISAQGVPLLVDSAAGRIEATSYRTSARSSAVRLPVAASG
jgi:hypothetical protein